MIGSTAILTLSPCCIYCKHICSCISIIFQQLEELKFWSYHKSFPCVPVEIGRMAILKSFQKGLKPWCVKHPNVYSRACTTLQKCQNCFLKIQCGAYLIFVTDTRTVSVEKKSVMWRNFKFLYRTDVEKSKISPHLD